MTYVIFTELDFLFHSVSPGDKKTPLKQRRLDYFLISDQLQEQTGLIDEIPSVQSDHSTIVIRINGLKDDLKADHTGNSTIHFSMIKHLSIS